MKKNKGWSDMHRQEPFFATPLSVYVFVYVNYVCVFICFIAQGWKSYPIVSKLSIQMRVVKRQSKFENKPDDSNRSEITLLQIYAM